MARPGDDTAQRDASGSPTSRTTGTRAHRRIPALPEVTRRARSQPQVEVELPVSRDAKHLRPGPCDKQHQGDFERGRTEVHHRGNALRAQASSPPRITFRFTLPRSGVTVERRQFPLRPCYAITVNKSQGQTLRRICYDVREHPFAHGQLYVGTSRVRNRRDILMLTRPSHLLDGKALTKNVVYPELLPSSARGRQAAPA